MAFHSTGAELSRVSASLLRPTGESSGISPRKLATESAPESLRAGFIQPKRDALLARSDTCAHASRRVAPEIALEYATGVLAALQGTVACSPRGYTRSTEEQFQDNEDGADF